jgi:predicted nucleotidyltransferase component of viral defense system
MATEIVGGTPLKAKVYATATAFRRALEDRLAAAAKTEGVDLQRIRRQVAFDRLLFRLFTESNPPWVLKGGYALELKFATARTTKDIDLGLDRLPGSGDDWNKRAGELLAVIQDKVTQTANDFFEFVIGEPMMELEAAPYSGARYPVEAMLDGRTFAKFHLDIGTGDVQREPVERIQPRDWLAFAGIPAPTFPSISREEHFAQKIHAYTFPRTERPNSRVKDLVDLVLLVDHGRIDHERLRVDILDTFARRKTHEAPVTLDPPPEFWQPTFARMAAECGIDPDITPQFEKVQRFYAALNLR